MARTYNSGRREWFNTSHNLNNQLGNAFVVEGLTELQQKLDKLLASNPDMERKIQTIIRKAMTRVRKKVEDYARSSVTGQDPRHAAKAIRKMVYRRILGGNLNILARRRRGSATNYTPTRTLKTGQRGGNRRLRGERTMRMESYEGADRGFILRFLNAGARRSGGRRQLRPFTTDEHRGKVKRGSQGGDVKKYGQTVNTGNRGTIAARNWFHSQGLEALQEAAEIIEQEIDKLIAEEFGKM